MRGGRRGIRSVASERHRRFRRAAWITIAVVVAGLVCSIFLVRWLDLRRLQTELEGIRADQQAALVEQDRLRAELDRRDDPEAIEDRAREELGLVLPGEEKVIFVDAEEETEEQGE